MWLSQVFDTRPHFCTFFSCCLSILIELFFKIVIVKIVVVRIFSFTFTFTFTKGQVMTITSQKLNGRRKNGFHKVEDAVLFESLIVFFNSKKI